jgi:hypothetical protein
MTLHIPLWVFALATVAVACVVASRFKSQGQWDFVTPLFGAAIVGGAGLFWLAFYLGSWLR